MSNYFIATTLDFPDSVLDVIFDKKQLNTMPFLESFYSHVISSIDITKKIENYDELVDFFEEEFDEYSEDDRLFKKVKKLLNDSNDLYVIELSDIDNHVDEFIQYLNKVKGFAVVDIDYD